MSTQLVQFLEAAEPALAAGLAADLRRANAPHYEAEDPERLRRRCTMLVQAFVSSTAGNPFSFVDYVLTIAQARVVEGYELHELQQALTALEVRAWQIPVERSNVAHLVQDLSVVTSTIGRAKDDWRASTSSRRPRPSASSRGSSSASTS
jgi:hypothetical protein